MVKFKDSINQIVSDKLFEEAFNDILFQTQLVPIGKPQIESFNLTKDSFNCVLNILTSPVFELKEIAGIEVPEPHIEKKVEDLVEINIQNIRKAYQEVVPYEDGQFVQINDKVTLDYTLSNGETDHGQLYTVGDELFPEFDENLFGMKPGEEKVFEVTSDIEGKVEKLQCTVLIHMGMKNVLPVFDDVLASKCGFKSADELLKTIKTASEINYKAVRDDLIKDQIKARIVSEYDFLCPEWLVEMEAQYLAITAGNNIEDFNEEDKKDLLKNAENNVRFTIVLDAIRRVNQETVLSDSDAINFIKSTFLRRGHKNVDSFLQESVNNGSIYGLMARAKNEYTLQWLADNAKVVS
jgi:trigger factor